MEPSHIIILGLVIAAMGVGWQLYRGQKSVKGVELGRPVLTHNPPTRPLTPAQIATVTAPLQTEIESLKRQWATKVDEAKIPAPYYTKTDIDRILEALFEVSDLVSKQGEQCRRSTDAFLGKWKTILLTDGEPGLRSYAEGVSAQIRALDQRTWDIVHGNQHYVKEIAPVFLDRAPVQRLLERISVFVQSSDKLPSNIDDKTLTLLEPTSNDVGSAYEAFDKWISSVFDKAAQETQRFRTMTQKAEK